jgi:hypothetical protein
MRAELKSLFSIDADPLDSYVPADPEHFGIFLQAFIGSTDSETFDSFDLFVCSPSWFAKHFEDEQLGRATWEAPGVRLGNRFLFMKRWDYEALRQTISDLSAHGDGADWGVLANRIGRHIPWEFDYRYDIFLNETATERPRFPREDQPLG